jgi:site-specific recombinase XerD
MSAKDIETYTPSVGLQFISEKIGYAAQRTLPRSKRDLLRGINALSDFVETGEIRKCKKRTVPITLEGPLGKIMTNYILVQKELFSLADSTVRTYYNYLSVFLSFLNVREIHSLQGLNKIVVLDFANNLTEYSSVTRHLIILKTNQFLAYLHAHKLLDIDLSKMVVDKYTYSPKLPSHYSEKEISQLITAIDRANPCGRRDYAILMLISRMGLRSSDVVNLKFENLLWDKQLLSLIQTKTHQSLQLPLLPEVGNAIIDYLKDGRPESSHQFVFLRLIPPYDKLHTAAINGMIKKYLNRAGIHYDERQHGPHSLRHSLATNLLKQQTSLPVISSILGHARIESTMNYLRVDTISLKRCALEVPPLGGGYIIAGKEESQCD